jgi:hypothetical protein
VSRHPVILAGALLLIVAALALPNRSPQPAAARHPSGLGVGP